MKLLKLLLVLISIFSISVYIRAPYIEKEVHPNNETSIIMLTVLENWQLKGISNYYFAPVITWQNDGDKYMANYKRLEDNRGNNYYVSYPPMAFIFPYIVSSFFNIVPNQILLQILNIILHFISAFMVYLIICKYFKKNPLLVYDAAIVGFISYTFIPVLLYTHTFDFFSEMMGQVFFLLGIYLFQLLEAKKDIPNNKLLLLFGLNIFILIYTEWIGIFFAFTLLFISITNYRKGIIYQKLIKTICLFSLLSILLIISQYNNINGFSNLARSLSLRFLERSGLFGKHYSDLGISYTNPNSYLLLFQQVHQTLIGFGYIAILLLLWWLIKTKYHIKRLFSINVLIIIILFPVILTFFVFFNATVIHYNWWARFGLIISIIIGLLFNKLFDKPTNLKNRILLGFIEIIVITVTIAFSIISFRNHAKFISTENPKLKYISTIVKQNSHDNESIFISLPIDMNYYNTYLCYMCKRNMVNVPNFEDANKILKEKHKVKGVFYTFENQSNQYTVKHFELK